MFFEIAPDRIDRPLAAAGEPRQLRMKQALAQHKPAIEPLVDKGGGKDEFRGHAKQDRRTGVEVLAPPIGLARIGESGISSHFP